MRDREPAIMKKLLERLLATRERRDREERFSGPWRLADAEMHAIERAIFRVPVETPDVAERAPEPTPIHTHDVPDRAAFLDERAG